jgi:hypothetical protein
MSKYFITIIITPYKVLLTLYCLQLTTMTAAMTIELLKDKVQIYKARRL